MTTRILALALVVATALMSVGCETSYGVGVGVNAPYSGYPSTPWGPGSVWGGPVWR